jgi:hypothetical protein
MKNKYVLLYTGAESVVTYVCCREAIKISARPPVHIYQLENSWVSFMEVHIEQLHEMCQQDSVLVKTVES